MATKLIHSIASAHGISAARQIGSLAHIGIWAFIAAIFISSAWSPFAIGPIAFFPVRLIAIIAIPLLLVHALSWRGLSLSMQVLMTVGAVILLSGAVSLAWSPDQILGLRTIGILYTGFAIAVVAPLLIGRQRSRFLSMGTAIAVISLIVGILGLYESVTGQYIIGFLDTDQRIINGQIERFQRNLGVLSPMVLSGNWNNHAGICVIGATISLGVALSGETSRMLRITCWIGTGVLLANVALCASRAAYIGTMVVGICLIMVRRRMVSSDRIRMAAILVVTGLIFPFIYALYFGVDLEQIAMKVLSKDVSIRMTYAQLSLSTICDNYLMGAGPGASSEILSGGNYHHHFIQIITEHGIIPFIAVIGLHCFLIFRCLRIAKSTGDPFAICLFGLGCALFPLSVGPSMIAIEPTFWLAIGMQVAFISLRESQPLHTQSSV